MRFLENSRNLYTTPGTIVLMATFSYNIPIVLTTLKLYTQYIDH